MKVIFMQRTSIESISTRYSSLALKKDANFCIDIRNPLSDYEIREKVVINPEEYIDQEENSREPPCHFAIKWDGSKKRSTVEILDSDACKSTLKKSGKKGKGGKGNQGEVGIPREMTAEDSGEFVPVLALECRGVEPFSFYPMGSEFVVVSEGGGKFDEDVDLSEGDWADYDEEHDISVSVSEFESKFVSA